jgi:hypothetical protein
VQTEGSQDSDNSATPVNLNTDSRQMRQASNETTEDTGDDWPDNWEKEWIAGDDDHSQTTHNTGAPSSPSLYKDCHVNRSFSSHAELVKLNSSVDSGDYATAKSDDELLGTHDALDSPQEGCSKRKFGIFNIGECPSIPVSAVEMEDDSQTERGLSNPELPLLGTATSASMSDLSGSHLPNGVLIVSPNGDVFAHDGASGKNVLVRPKTFSNFINDSTKLPQCLKVLPLKDNRVKSNIARSRTLEKISGDAITNDIDQHRSPSREPRANTSLDHLSKEQLYFMWKMSERELNRKLRQALEEKADLEQKLALMEPGVGT